MSDRHDYSPYDPEPRHDNGRRPPNEVDNWLDGSGSIVLTVLLLLIVGWGLYSVVFG